MTTTELEYEQLVELAFSRPDFEPALHDAFSHLDDAEYLQIIRLVLMSDDPALAEIQESIVSMIEPQITAVLEREAREHNEEMAVWIRYG